MRRDHEDAGLRPPNQLDRVRRAGYVVVEKDSHCSPGQDQIAFRS